MERGKRKNGDRYRKGRRTDLKIQPVAKKVATATGAANYNILQNNGRLAHQLVDHVCLFFPPICLSFPYQITIG